MGIPFHTRWVGCAGGTQEWKCPEESWTYRSQAQRTRAGEMNLDSSYNQEVIESITIFPCCYKLFIPSLLPSWCPVSWTLPSIVHGSFSLLSPPFTQATPRSALPCHGLQRPFPPWKQCDSWLEVGD